MQKDNSIYKLAWIYIKDKKILSTLTKGNDAYYIPGGKKENNETDEEALIREVKEELSIDLIPETIEFFGEFEAQAHSKPEGVKVKMRCFTADYQGKIKADNEIEKIVWLTCRDKDKCSPVDRIIFDYLKCENVIE